MHRPPAFTRRNLLRGAALGGTGLLLAPALLRPAPAFAQAGPVVQVGGIAVRPVSDGLRSMPVSLLWPDAPREDLASLVAGGGEMPAALPNPNNVTVIQTADRLIVVDAGAGPNFDPATGQLEATLRDAGIDPEAVTDVVFTHAHPDHLWGALDDFDDGPRFPNARHVITEAEHAYWTGPEAANGLLGEGGALAAARILGALGSALELVAPDAEIAPGVTLVPSAGHTPGHVCVRVSDGDQGLLVLGDVLTNAPVSFARPEWLVGTDTDPAAAAATRLRILDMASAEAIPVIGFHLPWPGIGHVERDGAAYAFRPA